MLIAFGMTLLGAIASYSFKVLNGEAFSWRTLFLQLFVSIFAGLTMVMIAPALRLAVRSDGWRLWNGGLVWRIAD